MRKLQSYFSKYEARTSYPHLNTGLEDSEEVGLTNNIQKCNGHTYAHGIDYDLIETDKAMKVL